MAQNQSDDLKVNCKELLATGLFSDLTIKCQGTLWQRKEGPQVFAVAIGVSDALLVLEVAFYN